MANIYLYSIFTELDVPIDFFFWHKIELANQFPWLMVVDELA